MTSSENSITSAPAWMRAFADELRAEARGFASVTLEPLGASRYWKASMIPNSPASAAFELLVLAEEMLVHFGSNGARIELEASEADCALAREIASAVIRGHLIERIASGRVHAEVTLADGTIIPTTVVDLSRGLLP